MFLKLYRFALDRGLKRGQVAILVVLGLAAISLETIGFGLLMPIGQYLIADGDLETLVAQSRFWELMVAQSEKLGFEIGIATVAVFSVSAMLCRQLVSYFRLIY